MYHVVLVCVASPRRGSGLGGDSSQSRRLPADTVQSPGLRPKTGGTGQTTGFRLWNINEEEWHSIW